MNINDFSRIKQAQGKICMLTCYDYPSARLISESPIDCVLVGDSVAMTVHGHPNTLAATVEMMLMHTAAVARGLNGQFLVTDLPFLTHRLGHEQTTLAVQKMMQAGAQAIKIEGGDAETIKIIGYLVSAGVPVMGHLGLTPQSLHQLGGFVVQGRGDAQQQILLEQAHALQEAGCFALVLECIPAKLAKSITDNLAIPTIGIGAGPDTDGQVLVWHDCLGLQTEFKPRFLKQYLSGKALMIEALNQYHREVNALAFPTAEHCY